MLLRLQFKVYGRFFPFQDDLVLDIFDFGFVLMLTLFTNVYLQKMDTLNIFLLLSLQ